MTNSFSGAATLALLLGGACGDDDTIGAAADAGGAGACGALQTKSSDVSAWCDTAVRSCDRSLDDHATRICALAAHHAATAIWAVPNACHGYSLSYAAGVDAYQEVAYYDADRVLVGVRVQTCATCCPELYGTDCGNGASVSDRLACPDADAGVAHWPWTQ